MKYWLCFLLSLSCVAVVSGQNQAERNQRDHHRQTFEKEKNARAAANKTPVILYHSGPVMVAPKTFMWFITGASPRRSTPSSTIFFRTWVAQGRSTSTANILTLPAQPF